MLCFDFIFDIFLGEIELMLGLAAADQMIDE